MSDFDDLQWSNAVINRLQKNKYHDLILILSVIMAFFMLIVVSALST